MHIAIVIIGLAALYACSVFATFALVISKHPNSDKTTGCPNDLPDCPPEKKMACYYDNMSFCCGLGVLGTISSLLFIIAIANVYILIRYLCGDEELAKNNMFVNICILDGTTNDIDEQTPINY